MSWEARGKMYTGTTEEDGMGQDKLTDAEVMRLSDAYAGLGKTAVLRTTHDEPHRHVFEDVDYGGLAPSYLLCACGQARRLQDFAGPEFRDGLRVRLTARGMRVLEQKACEEGRTGRRTSVVSIGDEGVMMLGPGKESWFCNFKRCIELVTAEMVEATREEPHRHVFDTREGWSNNFAVVTMRCSCGELRTFRDGRRARYQPSMEGEPDPRDYVADLVWALRRAAKLRDALQARVAESGVRLEDVTTHAGRRPLNWWMDTSAGYGGYYKRFVLGSRELHVHIFEATASADQRPCQPSMLVCACGAARRVSDFAGPELRGGMRVRLTARGVMRVEQTAERSGATSPWPWVRAGEVGTVGAEVAPGDIWECRFAWGAMLVSAETVEAV